MSYIAINNIKMTLLNIITGINIEIVELCLLIATVIFATGSFFISLKIYGQKPNIMVSFAGGKTVAEYHTNKDVVINILFKNKGSWYGKAAARDLYGWVNFPDNFKPNKIKQESGNSIKFGRSGKSSRKNTIWVGIDKTNLFYGEEIPALFKKS